MPEDRLDEALRPLRDEIAKTGTPGAELETRRHRRLVRSVPSLWRRVLFRGFSDRVLGRIAPVVADLRNIRHNGNMSQDGRLPLYRAHNPQESHSRLRQRGMSNPPHQFYVRNHWRTIAAPRRCCGCNARDGWKPPSMSGLR
jgi:hypothetical protein